MKINYEGWTIDTDTFECESSDGKIKIKDPWNVGEAYRYASIVQFFSENETVIASNYDSEELANRVIELINDGESEDNAITQVLTDLIDGNFDIPVEDFSDE